MNDIREYIEYLRSIWTAVEESNLPAAVKPLAFQLSAQPLHYWQQAKNGSPKARSGGMTTGQRRIFEDRLKRQPAAVVGALSMALGKMVAQDEITGLLDKLTVEQAEAALNALGVKRKG
jgi:hypothetical protein